jgi:Zn finger protein HypA/HybF involved in hydrogenase expression
MSHDHNGRVGGPRCEECNAPLSADDTSERLCLECQQLELQLSGLRNLHVQYFDSIANTRDRYDDGD